ncbi:hypothetical protein CASFOL_038055 [Castilleja foliolosa]|uniref:Uncharacterized protein n=1 Tax=Castilleja foliolosa TaxID=1961234 RepID=A0ABD3BKI6_9LAMI
MGKESTTKVMNQRKKEARAPNNSLSISTPQNPINYDSTNGRSIRRNPNLANFPPPGFSSDDDDERKEKKSKLVVQLPQSEENDKRLNNQKQLEKKNNNKHHSGSGSDSGPEPEDPVNCAKSDGAAAIQDCDLKRDADLFWDNSVARFAADLGPTAWKVASRKIESALPAGTPYGPGWVSESGPYSHPSAGNFNLNLSASDLNTGYAPAPEGLANRSAYMKTPFPPFISPKSETGLMGCSGVIVIHLLNMVPRLFPRMWGPHGGTTIFQGITNHFVRDEAKVPESWNVSPLGYQNQVVGSTSRNDHLSAMTNRFVQDEANVHGNWTGYQMTGQGYSHGEGEMSGFGKSALPAQQMVQSNVLSGRPDLNVRIQSGSPSSSLQIGSPDLALDL